MNLFIKFTPKSDRQKLQQIKKWVDQILDINPEIAISISQLQCHEPDCPPVETIIAIMTTPPQQYKIHKPISEITKADIKQILD